jgi:hypothetical protein
MELQIGNAGTGGTEESSAADAFHPLSVTERLSAEIAGLKELDLEGLRQRWRKLFRAAAPPHLPKYLLFRVLAYRIQANALGDLDRETIRYLDQVARDSEQRRIKGAGTAPSKPSAAPQPTPTGRLLKPGAILVREHAGVLHRVVVMENGFAWEGKTFRSLSEAAQAITGTNWNGPRFFGLRSKSPEASRSSGLLAQESRSSGIF